MAQRHAKNTIKTKKPDIAACACGSSVDNGARRAAGVDPETKAANLRRLRRLEGQIRGLQNMIEADRYCPDIMIQVSAAQEALRTVGRELMRNHLRHCVIQSVMAGPEKSNPMFDELLELIYKHSR